MLVPLVSIFCLVLLTFLLIWLFIVFNNRKNKLITEKKDIKKSFEVALSNSQIEIREETLRNISWELHDNIGQLISLAKINAQLAKNDLNKINEVISILTSGMNELRALSKAINPESIKKLSLVDAIQLEIERYNRLEFISSTLHVEGIVLSIDPEIQIILFRILQEFFSNTVKHSKASKLNVTLKYQDNALAIFAEDNGIGFQINSDIEYKGIGLQNMKNRAKIINAEFELASKIKKGTSLSIKYFHDKSK